MSARVEEKPGLINLAAPAQESSAWKEFDVHFKNFDREAWIEEWHPKEARIKSRLLETCNLTGWRIFERFDCLIFCLECEYLKKLF
jgi:hypothetical protein